MELTRANLFNASVPSGCCFLPPLSSCQNSLERHFVVVPPKSDNTGGFWSPPPRSAALMGPPDHRTDTVEKSHSLPPPPFLPPLVTTRQQWVRWTVKSNAFKPGEGRGGEAGGPKSARPPTPPVHCLYSFSRSSCWVGVFTSVRLGGKKG